MASSIINGTNEANALVLRKPSQESKFEHAVTNQKLAVIKVYSREDPHRTTRQIPLALVSGWGEFQTVLSNLTDERGRLVVYGEDGSIIPSKLWSHFAQAGATFGYSFHLELDVVIEVHWTLDSKDLLQTFKFSVPENTTVFDLRRHINRTISKTNLRTPISVGNLLLRRREWSNNFGGDPPDYEYLGDEDLVGLYLKDGANSIRLVALNIERQGWKGKRNATICELPSNTQRLHELRLRFGTQPYSFAD